MSLCIAPQTFDILLLLLRQATNFFNSIMWKACIIAVCIYRLAGSDEQNRFADKVHSLRGAELFLIYSWCLLLFSFLPLFGYSTIARKVCEIPEGESLNRTVRSFSGWGRKIGHFIKNSRNPSSAHVRWDRMQKDVNMARMQFWSVIMKSWNPLV